MQRTPVRPPPPSVHNPNVGSLPRAQPSMTEKREEINKRVDEEIAKKMDQIISSADLDGTYLPSAPQASSVPTMTQQYEGQRLIQEFQIHLPEYIVEARKPKPFQSLAALIHDKKRENPALTEKEWFKKRTAIRTAITSKVNQLARYQDIITVDVPTTSLSAELQDVFQNIWQEAIYTGLLRYTKNLDEQQEDERERQKAVSRWDEIIQTTLVIFDQLDIPYPKMDIWMSYSSKKVRRKPGKPKVHPRRKDARASISLKEPLAFMAPPLTSEKQLMYNTPIKVIKEEIEEYEEARRTGIMNLPPEKLEFDEGEKGARRKTYH